MFFLLNICPPSVHGRIPDHYDYSIFLEHLNSTDIAIGIFLFIASVGSVLPQHIKILKSKSVKGLSGSFLLLALLNQSSTVANAIVLKYPQIEACSYVGLYSCLPSLITLFQLGGLFLAYYPLYIYFLKYFDNPYADEHGRGIDDPYFQSPHSPRYIEAMRNALGDKTADGLSPRRHQPFRPDSPSNTRMHSLRPKSWVDSKFVPRIFSRVRDASALSRARLGMVGLMLYIVFITILSILFLYLYGSCSVITRTWGGLLGIIAMIFNSICLIPQIISTYKSKSVGAFSILMVIIQAPGALVMLAFMAFIAHEAWTTWLSYLTSACFQFILLGLLLKYRNNKPPPEDGIFEDQIQETPFQIDSSATDAIIQRHSEGQNSNGEGSNPSDTTPLLS